jgi:Flp pilus assembly protein TadG
MSAVLRRLFRRARARTASPLRRFARNNRGVAAIEFALVVLPFLALLFAIIETAMVFFATQVLETAVADSARLVMTGQAQDGGFTQASFKTAVCSRISALFDCKNKMYIDVRTFAQFAAISMNSPTKDSKVVDNFVYQPGGPGDIVVVRLLYPWPVYVQLWNPQLTNLKVNAGSTGNDSRLLVATAAFRNEPF